MLKKGFSNANLLVVDPDLKCKVKEHLGDKIESFCTYKQCAAGNRLACGYCKYRMHKYHTTQLISLNQFSTDVLAGIDRVLKYTETIANDNRFLDFYRAKLKNMI